MQLKCNTQYTGMWTTYLSPPILGFTPQLNHEIHLYFCLASQA